MIALVFRSINPIKKSENIAAFKYLLTVLKCDSKKNNYVVYFADFEGNKEILIDHFKKIDNLILKPVKYHTYSLLLHTPIVKRFIHALWHKKVVKEIQRNPQTKFVHIVNTINFDCISLDYSNLNVPVLWGPIEGGVNISTKILASCSSFKSFLFIYFFNFINQSYFRHSLKIKKAISNYKIISGSRLMSKAILKFHNKEVITLPDTCISALKVSKSQKIKSIDKTKLNLVWIGDLTVRKNLYFIIDVMKIINNKNVNLFICGNGKINKINKLKEKIKNYSNIHFLGFLNNKELDELLLRSDFSIFSSLRDAHTNAFTDSLESLTPMILNDNIGAEDFYDTNELKYNLKDRKNLAILINKINKKKYDNTKYIEWYSEILDYLRIKSNEYSFKFRFSVISKFYNEL